MQLHTRYVDRQFIIVCILLLSILGGAIGSPAQTPTIITCAGTGVDGNTGNGSLATAAKLSAPVCVTTDAAGNLYIADADANVVRKVNSAGIITTIAGNDTAGYSGDSSLAIHAMLSAPLGIAIDKAGNLYIADNSNNVIRKVDAAGVITTVAGTGVAGYGGDNGPATAAQLHGPNGLATDTSGNLYIADRQNYIIRKIDNAGIITTIAGTQGVWGYTGNGGLATSAKIGDVFGIKTDHSGNLFIAESYTQHIIRKINAAGVITLVAGDDSSSYSGDGMPAINTYISGPADIAVDDSGNIYFSEENDNVIRKINTTGILSTAAGNYTTGYGGDNGDPTMAKLNQPAGIAIDNAGNLYIADQGNHRVRKIYTSSLGVATSNFESSILLSPNPSNGLFRLTGMPTDDNVVIRVTNMAGQQVYEQKAAATKGASIGVALPRYLPAGIYEVNVVTATFTKTTMLQLER